MKKLLFSIAFTASALCAAAAGAEGLPVVEPAASPEETATPALQARATSAPTLSAAATDAFVLPTPAWNDAPAASFSLAAQTDLVAQTDSVATAAQRKKTRFLPMRRRMDREINKIKYVYKGEMMMGLTASYGTLSSEDSDLWLVIDGINLDASIVTVNPFVGYFFRDNLCAGFRFGYSRVSGDLRSAALDLGETNDINFSVSDILLKNENYSFGVFLRSYAGLDTKGHFGFFGEIELSMSSGSSEFSYRTGGDLRQTFGDNTKVKLSFNPGMAVYIFPNVNATISFGLGGLQWVKNTQKDAEGVKTGSRTYSNMRFRLNLAEIRIGMTIHLWNKNKDRKKTL